MSAETTVVDATTAILQARGKIHGDFKDHARITSKLKDVLLEECRDRNLRGQPPLTLEMRESLDMIMHKVGRIIAGKADHLDHWDDIAGYARLVGDRYRPVPLNPRIAQSLRDIEARTPACPDLDQEYDPA